MIHTYAKRSWPIAAAALIVVTLTVLVLCNRQGRHAFALEQSLEAAKNVRTMHLIEEVPIDALKREAHLEDPDGWAAKEWPDFKDARRAIATRAEFWAQFDNAGKLLHLRTEWPLTDDGFKVVLWDPAEVQVWLKTKNTLGIASSDLTDGAFTEFGFYDPKTVLKQLDGEVASDVATMTPEDASSGQPSRFKVVSAGSCQIYTIDPGTKLLKSVEIYDTSGGEVQVVSIKRFADYNAPMDGGLWEVNAPKDVAVFDQRNRTIGLARGSMSNEEVAKEVARQFLDAWIARDFAKVGALYGGMSADKAKEAFGKSSLVRAVSIGEPVRDSQGPNGYTVPCQIELESSGRRALQNVAPFIRPVQTHPGRWAIDGGI